MIPRSSHSAAEQVLELQVVTIDHMASGRKIRAVEEISFKVGLGERFVLMGRSGCGKTTLLKAVGGFIQPNQGNIILNGKSIKKPGPDRMIIWQDLDQLLPWKTVEENVAYALVMKGFRKKEALTIANEWLERVGLGQSSKRYPHELSGGMKQRTAIARGFAAKPQLLLMDEPFSALDALTRHRLQDELIALQEKFQVSVLFVSHDVNEAVRVGTHILVLSPAPGKVLVEYSAKTPHLKKQILEQIFKEKDKHA